MIIAVKYDDASGGGITSNFFGRKVSHFVRCIDHRNVDVMNIICTVICDEKD